MAKEEKKVRRRREKKNLLMIGVERDGGTAGIWVLMAGSLAARTFGNRKNYVKKGEWQEYVKKGKWQIESEKIWESLFIGSEMGGNGCLNLNRPM